MKFRKPNWVALVFYLLAVASWTANFVVLFSDHASIRLRLLFATSAFVFQCAACAAQFGKDIWDPRLIPWSAKNRP